MSPTPFTRYFHVRFKSPSGLHLRVAAAILSAAKVSNVTIAIGRSDTSASLVMNSVCGILLLNLTKPDDIAVLRVDGRDIAVAEFFRQCAEQIEIIQEICPPNPPQDSHNSSVTLPT